MRGVRDIALRQTRQTSHIAFFFVLLCPHVADQVVTGLEGPGALAHQVAEAFGLSFDDIVQSLQPLATLMDLERINDAFADRKLDVLEDCRRGSGRRGEGIRGTPSLRGSVARILRASFSAALWK